MFVFDKSCLLRNYLLQFTKYLVDRDKTSMCELAVRMSEWSRLAGATVDQKRSFVRNVSENRNS